MKEIDNIVKKVLLESLNEKADEITKKIQGKISGDMKEDEMGEGRFKDALKTAYKKKHPEEKTLPASLKKKYFSDDEDNDEDETDVMSGEFDYVGEGECMEGDCGKMEESMVPGEGEEYMKKYRRGSMQKLLSLYGHENGPGVKHLKNELGIEDDDSEMKEELYGNQKKIDVAKPKGKITAADFAKLRKGKMNEKWEGDTEVEKTGEYSGMSVAQLDKAIKALKSKTAKLQDEGKKVPKSMKEKMSELYFAKRAKQGWKGKGSAKVDEEMEEGNAFSGALANAKKEGKKEFTVDGKKYPVKETYKYLINFGKGEIILSENELINMIEEIVLEEKNNNIKSTGRSKGMVEYDRVHKKDEDTNKKALKDVEKKMRDYVKAGSKGNFEMNPKNFPKGNGQLAKMDKKAYIPSDAVDEYVSDFAYPGQTNLTFDEIKPDDEKIKKYLEGDATTGNSSEYANAETTEVGKKFYKNYEDNAYGAEQKEASYKRVTAPVDVAGENKGAKTYKKTKGQKALNKLSESNEKKEVLNEEMSRIMQLLSYNKKTQ